MVFYIFIVQNTDSTNVHKLDWMLVIIYRVRELFYDWRFTANQFVLAKSPLRPTIRIFIFQLNTCGYIPYATSSLTRG
jgi:hypothetical protein